MPLHKIEPDAAGRLDPITEHYLRDVDRTLLVQNLRRSPEERILNLMALQAFADALRQAGRAARRER